MDGSPEELTLGGSGVWGPGVHCGGGSLESAVWTRVRLLLCSTVTSPGSTVLFRFVLEARCVLVFLKKQKPYISISLLFPLGHYECSQSPIIGPRDV